MFRTNPTPDNDRGSILVAILFVILASTIVATALATAIGGNLLARTSAARQVSQDAAQEALDQATFYLNWNPNPDAPYTGCQTGALNQATYKWCTAPERLAGEPKNVGVSITIKTTSTGHATRYYKAHLLGFLSAKNTTQTPAGMDLFPVDGFMAPYGFTANGKLEIGTGATGSLYSYAAGPTLTTTPGAPVGANQFVLGATSISKALRFTQANAHSGAGNPVATPEKFTTCEGAGCSGSSIVQTSVTPSPFQILNQTASSPTCAAGKVYRSSESAGALTINAAGNCYVSMTFDQNTTISGTGLVQADHVVVEPGVQVNMALAAPNTRNFGLRVNDQFIVGSGASFAGRVDGAACRVENANYFGSLHCVDVHGTGSKFYWQKELADQDPLTTGTSGSTITPTWSGAGLRPTDYREIRAAEAGAI